jgi:DNA-directed RNA polymerase specialized sigma24 family protein
MRTRRTTADERGLIDAARTGGPDGFAAFYEHFEKPVLRYFARGTGMPDVTADLTAETIERLSAGQERVLRERDYPEIARDLQCSEAVVRQRVSRGLRGLRTRLAGD